MQSSVAIANMGMRQLAVAHHNPSQRTISSSAVSLPNGISVGDEAIIDNAGNALGNLLRIHMSSLNSPLTIPALNSVFQVLC